MLKRPVGRPPLEVRRYFASFSYQAKSWKERGRVVAKVEWRPGELYPRVGFIVGRWSVRQIVPIVLPTSSPPGLPGHANGRRT